MIKVRNLYKSYGPLAVLSNVSFTLERGQRAALVGNNGSGKSTLLRILAGTEEADSGDVEIDEQAGIGYLPQDTSLSGNEPIEHYLKREAGIDVLEAELSELSASLSDPQAKQQYDAARARYEALEGYSFGRRAQVMLSGFGLEQVDLSRPVSSLSSGQKNKVALIAILLKEADLLLLDEPTNNLDLTALVWLEYFLCGVDAACIIVSHDRRFLDRTSTEILDLDWKTHSVTVTGGAYSDHLRMMAKRRERQKEQYWLQQEEIERLSQQARRMKTRAGTSAHRAGADKDKFLKGFKKGRVARLGQKARVLEKRIEQMEKIAKPFERAPLEIPLQAEKGHGGLQIRLTRMVAGYPDGFSIGPISLGISYGERIGIMGLNGSGKSTLFKVIAGSLEPRQGRVDIGSGVRFGDMMQEHDSLPRESLPLEFLQARAGLSEQNAYAKMVNFGLDRNLAHQPVRKLSPGSRARLLLAAFSALSVNTLLLDEPTNHLDIEAMEALEEALANYRGTVILASHDRFFLEKAGLTSTFLLADGKLTAIENYQVYVSAAEQRARRLLRLF